MKNIFKSIMLFALIGLSAQSYSQVILNGGSFEPIYINSDYTVPNGKILIITHLNFGSSSSIMYVNNRQVAGQGPVNAHLPLRAGDDVEISTSGTKFMAGYLIDVDEWGATSDVPDEEIIDNDGGGIEIYPNPTDDLASVFVDYPGDWKMTVYDINGQIVLETQSETPVKSIDTNALSAGTYIVSVRAKRKLIGSSQLIVQ